MLDPALLTVGTVYPQTPSFMLDNAGYNEVGTCVDGFASVTVAYDYTAAAVPLPGNVWLPGSGLQHSMSSGKFAACV